MVQELVSVIVPTYNRKDKVIRLLRSIFAQTYRTFEIIVVDDSSTDGTKEKIQFNFPGDNRLRLIRNKTNQHAAGSRNIGTKHAKGKYLFYVDDDNVLDKNALKELIMVFQSNENIGELGLVNRSFRDKNIIFWLKTNRSMWSTRTFLPVDSRKYFQHRIWDTDDVPNAYIIRSDIIRKHNISFCPLFGIMYEESDLAYRIRKLGYEIKVVREAVIYHDVGNYMDHFVADLRMPYAFARNRIIFHSIYSTKVQFTGILVLWIWLFMFFYWYKVFIYTGSVMNSNVHKLRLMNAYFLGNLTGLLFVLRGEKLTYPALK